MNQWLFFGPVSMILVGLFAIIYFHKTRRTDFILYSWGGLLWLISVGIKVILDFTITPYFLDFINSVIPSFFIVITCLFVGLRTGFFESGFSYLILKNRLKKFSFNDAVAVGIGFGATEAIILGLLSLINMLMLANPSLIASLPEAERALVEAQLNQDSLIIFAPLIERVFTILAHVFATVLIIKALISKRLNFLWMSVFYKFVLDAPVPFFQVLIADGNILMTYFVELYVMVLGLFAFFALRRFSRINFFNVHEVKKRSKKV